MPPADFPLVLLVGASRVDDEDIHISEEVDQLGTGRRGVGLGLLALGPVASGRDWSLAHLRFVIGEIGNRSVGRISTPVPDTDAGVINKARLDSHLSDLEFHVPEFLDINRARHTNREKLGLHLAGEDGG